MPQDTCKDAVCKNTHGTKQNMAQYKRRCKLENEKWTAKNNTNKTHIAHIAEFHIFNALVKISRRTMCLYHWLCKIKYATGGHGVFRKCRGNNAQIDKNSISRTEQIFAPET